MVLPPLVLYDIHLFLHRLFFRYQLIYRFSGQILLDLPIHFLGRHSIAFLQFLPDGQSVILRLLYFLHVLVVRYLSVCPVDVWRIRFGQQVII